MKKITIGRGRECDIRLDDSTDIVSRRQAVITFTMSGKMEIFDTSSNGTYVNGEKIAKPAGKEIKRGDQINFAHVVDLDWAKVKDPYKPLKIKLAILAFLVVIAAVVAVLFLGKGSEQTTVTPNPVEQVDTAASTFAPAEPTSDVKPGTRTSGKTGGGKSTVKPPKAKDPKVAPSTPKGVEEAPAKPVNEVKQEDKDAVRNAINQKDK